MSTQPPKILTHFVFPKGVVLLCQTLNRAGFLTCIIGGAIRNILLKRPVVDYDFATQATPQEMKQLFKKSVDFAAQFGTMIIPDGTTPGRQFQVTTFRKDGIYSDQRRPDEVVFSTDINEDLARRDFTVNAMAFDPIDNQFWDPFGGEKDLQSKQLVCVGAPTDRLTEDTLRIFRAVRLSGELGFDIAEEVKSAILTLGPVCQLPAKERILAELEKLILAPQPGPGFHLLNQATLMKRIFGHPIPEDVLSQISDISPEGRWAHLFRDINPEHCLKQLPFSRQTRRWIQRVLRYNGDISRAKWSPAQLAISGDSLKAMGFSGREIGQVLEELCDRVSQNPSDNHPVQLTQYAQQLRGAMCQTNIHASSDPAN